MAEKLIGIIGGTGLGDALGGHIEKPQFCDVETPFGEPSGPVMLGNIGRNKIAFLNRHGKGHRLSPSEVPAAANIFALKKLGVRALIATGTVGSLREEIAPGDLVVVDQFIDKTFKRVNTFFGGFAAVHCEMTQPVCSRLCGLLVDAARSIGVKTHPKGCYVCMEGPQFSTRAESLMHRAWGGDLVGMTAMPEAKLARESQICYTLIALASDYDCWRLHEPDKNRKTLLQEITANLQTATDNCLQLLRAALTSKSSLINEDCQCRKSLDMAVWTDQARLDPAAKDKLKVLFD